MSGEDSGSNRDTDVNATANVDSDDEGDSGAGADPTASGERPAPLADLAADVNERRERITKDGFEAPFAEQPYEEIDEDSVWEAVGEEDEESEFGAVGEVIEAGEKTYVVSKRNFCERCRHFSEPPDVRCTHKGTEIREFVDMDHVRLYSCPIVEERGLGGERRAE